MREFPLEMEPTDRGYAEINGARLWYEVIGMGAPVVLLHAGIADSQMWNAQVPALAGRERPGARGGDGGQ